MHRFYKQKIGLVKMILSHNYSEFVGETHLVVKTEILCDKRKICDTKNHA